jgi:peptidoglycan/xylan/chitin deacetylase (PgdA/CDA1 family)
MVELADRRAAFRLALSLSNMIPKRIRVPVYGLAFLICAAAFNGASAQNGATVARPQPLVAPQPLTAPGPVADQVTVMARTDDFLILDIPPGVTYAMLAERFLGNANLAGAIQAANDKAPAGPDRPIIVPLKPANASSVYYDGYQTVAVLCYHRFSEGGSNNQMVMPRASFRRQMEYLRDNGYNVISLAQLEEFMNGSAPIPPRSVVITVDDGFRSAYDIAFPILKEFGFPATFFIYTDFVGPRLALDWDAITELEASGIVDIQSHSKTHTSFAPTPEEDNDSAGYQTRLRSEVDTPRQILERRLGAPVRYLAYPYGDTSESALDILGAGGFSLALTVERGGNPSFGNRYVLRRDMIFGDATMDDFRESLRVFAPEDLD